MPRGLCTMAACGTTTASFRVRTVMLTLAKAPGQSRPALLSKRAFTFTVPEAASTTLSTNCRRPLSSPPLSGSVATTSEPPSFSAASASARWRCGRLNETAIGSSWVMVTSVVWLACTALPTNTGMLPTRPALGAVMRA